MKDLIFSSGIDETFRGWNGTVKVKLSPFLITLSGGEKRVDGLIYQRRGSLEFFFLFSDFYAAAVFSLLSDTSQDITITGEGKLSVGIKVGTGELFFSYDGSLMLSQNRKGFSRRNTFVWDGSQGLFYSLSTFPERI